MSENWRIPIETTQGMYLPEVRLWLDAPRRKPFCFVSHAHSDHAARHEETLCTPATAAMLRARYPSKKARYLELPFGETLERHGFRLLLIPAGHVWGSAMLHATRLADGATFLYTGDFKLKPGLASEAGETMRADTVIMECTFGRPRFVFPEREEIRKCLMDFCRSGLENGASPLLLGYSLGKAQEILMMLEGSPWPILVHPTVAEMCRVYESLGVHFPAWSEFSSDGRLSGAVIIAPPGASRQPPLAELARKVTAMVSGWGILPSAKYQYGVDAVFPLSDHADYPDLLRFVELVQPKLLLATHGYCAEFTRDLRERGWNAWSLAGNDQMDLGLTYDQDGVTPVFS